MAFSRAFPSEPQKRLKAWRLAEAILRPAPKLPPDEWARRHRVYPETSGLPGPRDPRLTPYVVPVDLLLRPRVLAGVGAAWRPGEGLVPFTVNWISSTSSLFAVWVLGGGAGLNPVFDVASAAGNNTNSATANFSTPGAVGDFALMRGSKLTPLLQHAAPSWIPGIQAPSPGGLHSAVRAGGCATQTGFAARAGAEAAHALTINPDH